jgi:hypothetical protein
MMRKKLTISIEYLRTYYIKMFYFLVFLV